MQSCKTLYSHTVTLLTTEKYINNILRLSRNYTQRYIYDCGQYLFREASSFRKESCEARRWIIKVDINMLLAQFDKLLPGGLLTVDIYFTSIAFLCFSGVTLGRTGYTRPRGLGKEGSCAPSIYGTVKIRRLCFPE